MRGTFAEELFATANLTGVPILAPSFPAMGRTMVNGQLLVNGVPLQKTEVWKNEKRSGPPTLSAMLNTAGFQTEVIHLETVRGDQEMFRLALEKATGIENRAIVCDAETENDLASIIKTHTLLETALSYLIASTLRGGPGQSDRFPIFLSNISTGF